MKIINDPVFGFIRVPSGPLLDIVNHPAFFRLTRIKQLGLASVVYPGAQHTRFQHSLGAFHLMTRATESLKRKGQFIFDSEEEAVLAAILLHDVGHGPFSHVLENTLTEGISHEDISLMIMQRMNDEMGGLLTLAIKLFQGDYPKQFLHQLISSQLDVDRLDYLRRDSFFTGVTEGNIGSARIIDMLNVVDDHLVVEKKGIYSIENYLVTRRLMYWQVYLHKTAVAAEHVLINALRRAKWLAGQGVELFASPSLHYYLYREVSRHDFESDEQALEAYLALDDSDIWCALSVWQQHEDKVLSILARDFINRRIFRVEVSDEPFSEEYVGQKVEEQARHWGLSTDDARYLVALKEVGKDMYNPLDDRIEILDKDGSIHDVTEVSDMLNIDTLSKHVRKYYLCTQRIEQ
jgi:HD superfamily phosphohydrolase